MQFKADRSRQLLFRTLGVLSRHAIAGNFAELIDYESRAGEVRHARSYIWPDAAYLSVIFKMILGLDLSDSETVRFRPMLPSEIGGAFRVEGLRLGRTEIDVELRGAGSSIRSVTVNGSASEANARRESGDHDFEIGLGDE